MTRALFFGLLISVAIPTNGQDRLPIIDMHMHATPANAFGVYCPGDQEKYFLAVDPDTEVDPEGKVSLHPWLESCPNPIVPPETTEELIDEVISRLNKYNIVGVMAGGPGDLEPYLQRVPERIIPAQPFTSGDQVNIDSLRSRILRGQIKVLGEIWLQYAGLNPSGPEMDNVYELAVELDVPVGIHIGPGPAGGIYYFNFPNYRASLTNPLLLEDALVKYPRLRLNIMHAGYPFADELIAVLHAHPRVYVDVAYLSWALPRKEFHRYMQRLVDAGMSKRIMFATDQVVWPSVIDIAIESIETATFLTEEQRRDIFYNNAARYLRLSDQEIARHHGN